eukprot:jgi/Mesvir1/3861/Mv19822-RA.1
MQSDFKRYSVELDEANARRERLVKLSRDTTINSKKAIFALQRLHPDLSNKAEVLAKAQAAVDDIIRGQLAPMVAELNAGGAHARWRFRRAFSPGLQEFIEAATLLHFLQTDGRLLPREALEEQVVRVAGGSGQSSGPDASTATPRATEPSGRSDPSDAHAPELGKQGANVSAPQGPCISEVDYLMGIADLTGEVMRLAIARASATARLGDLQAPCAFVRDVYNNFLMLPSRLTDASPKDMSQKISTMAASLAKMEQACYALRVRCSEWPPEIAAKMLPLALSSTNQNLEGDTDGQ